MTIHALTATVPLVEIERVSVGGFAKGEDGTMYPVLSSFKVDDQTLPYVVTVEMGLVAGKPVVRGLYAAQRAGGSPVTRRGLNSLPLGLIIEEISTQFSLQIEGPRDAGTARPSNDQEQARIRRVVRPARGRSRDESARRELVERVADLYRELIAQQIRHPKPEIARELGYSVSYIGALVAEARSMTPPLIPPPAGPGRASDGATGKSTQRKRGKR